MGHIHNLELHSYNHANDYKNVMSAPERNATRTVKKLSL